MKKLVLGMLIVATVGLKAFDSTFVISESYWEMADYLLDDKHRLEGINKKASKIKAGDIIYVNPEYFNRFEKYRKKIKCPYFLITHASDTPSPSQFSTVLNDPNLIHWFAENPDMEHHKVTPIPLGPTQYKNILPTGYAKEYFETLKSGCFGHEKKYNLLCNFRLVTNSEYRKPLLNKFKEESYVYFHHTGSDVIAYLNDLKHSRFVLSPRGSGLDCHRTWEALLLGCIPIVITSLLDPIFEDLPVLIINDWNEVTEELLDKTYEEFSTREFNYEKMWFSYCKRLIQDKQREFLSKK